MKLTVKQLEELFFEEELEIDGQTLEYVESTEWEQDHKSQSKTVIFTDGIKFYAGEIGRSGSPFSDWTYNSEVYSGSEQADIDEVKQARVYTKKWVAANYVQEQTPEELALIQAKNLLSDANDLLDDVHCYETQTYKNISKFLEEN